MMLLVPTASGFVSPMKKHTSPASLDTDKFIQDLDSHEAATQQYYMPESVLPPLANRPAISTHRLSRLDVQRAINDIKRFVEARLETDLDLVKHTAPLAFMRGTGVNDELDGSKSKSAVRFTVPNQDIPRGIKMTEEELLKLKSPYEMDCEIVQSLAKWKRIMLNRLEIPVGKGIYCDSTSIRKGYKGDVTHSVVADQWDFEIRITRDQRNVEQLKEFVRTIYKIITDAEDFILEKYPQILLPGHPSSEWCLPKEIKFITAEDLHKEFPGLDVHGREDAAVNKYGAIFIIGMGWPMSDGSMSEEVRSPGYDDWNLNGKPLVFEKRKNYLHLSS
jgi:aspartate--ammonia ligase